MVLSKINRSISYKDNKKIDEEDVGHISPIYSMPIFDKDVAVVIGKPKQPVLGSEKTTKTTDIVYYSIYLLSNKKIISQIGVFESKMSSGSEPFIFSSMRSVNEKDFSGERPKKFVGKLDEDGDLDLSHMDDPLLFDFVTEEFISKINSNPKDYEKFNMEQELSKMITVSSSEKKSDISDEDDDDDDDDDEMDVLKEPSKTTSASKKKAEKIIEEGIFTKEKNFVIPLLLKEEDEKVSTEIKAKYTKMSNHNWIQMFTRNINYGITDNEGGGDCLFAVIRDAYRSIGKNTTVSKLRALLASEATDEIFQQNRNLYLSFETNKEQIEKEIRDIKRSLNIYKKRYDAITENNTETKKRITAEVQVLNEKIKSLRNDLRETLSYQRDYIGSMKDINTLGEFREYIQTSGYWANEWAISTLEVLLNVKIIILSKESYDNNAFDNILNCGEVSKLMPENPTEGIIGHDGVQYPPFHPKHYIITCYTGNHYTLVSYKNKRILSFEEIPYDIKIMILNKCLEKNAGVYYLIPEFRNFKSGLISEAVEEQKEQDQIRCEENDDNAVIFLYHASAFDAKVGKGNGEKINISMITNYLELNKMKDWRKKIDDMYICPFMLDEHRWCSVENYLQGSKFKKNHKEFYLKFSLDSNTDISKDPSLAKEVGTKKSKRPKEVTIDPDYDLGRSETEREDAVRAKFFQNEDLKQILLATKNSCIKHFKRRNSPETDDTLMKIRGELFEKM